MKLRGIKISGVKVKDGKVIKSPMYASVSQRLKSKGSKRVRVARKGTI